MSGAVGPRLREREDRQATLHLKDGVRRTGQNYSHQKEEAGA